MSQATLRRSGARNGFVVDILFWSSVRNQAPGHQGPMTSGVSTLKVLLMTYHIRLQLLPFCYVLLLYVVYGMQYTLYTTQ